MMLAASFLEARITEDGCEAGNTPRPRREAEAKRTLLSMHMGGHECPSAEDNCGWWISDDDPCPTVCVLAAIYSDHPDYQNWKPDRQ